MINYNLLCNLIYLCCFRRWKVSTACRSIYWKKDKGGKEKKKMGMKEVGK